MTGDGRAMSSPATVVTEDRFRSGIIEPRDFVADTEAFLDVRIERSKGKASYSMIGPGVSQNADQVINLTEPHGFNIGAATMPSGVVNNPHLHYSAEVFVCTRGQWRFTIGEHDEQSLDLGADTVFSVPTWVFRGFTNIGSDDGWVFTVLGGDDTGGILWAPRILREAADTGLYLTADMAVVESLEGPPDGDIVAPVAPESLVVDTYSDAALEEHVLRPEGRDWSERALLSSVVPGHEVALAPVIGHGLTQDRGHRPPIEGAHGFSVEWLRIQPGQSTGWHQVGAPVVLFLCSPDFEISMNEAPETLVAEPDEGAVVSVPAYAWRAFTNTGNEPVEAIVVRSGEEPTPPSWPQAVVKAAAEAGWSTDVRGKLAPIELLGFVDHESQIPTNKWREKR